MVTAFNSVENLNLIMNIFKEYIFDKFNIQINEKEHVFMKQHIYKLMQLVPDQMKNKAGNIQVLNAAKDYYMQQRSIVHASAPTEVAENKAGQVYYMQQRSIVHAPAPTEKIMKPTTEVAENKEDFLKKLKEFEMRRNGIVVPPAAPAATPAVVYLPILEDEQVCPFMIFKDHGAFIYEKTIPFTTRRKYVMMKSIEATSNVSSVYQNPTFYKIIGIDGDKVTLDGYYEKKDFSIEDHILINSTKYIITAHGDRYDSFHICSLNINRVTGDYDPPDQSLLNHDIINLHTRPVFIYA